MRYVYFTKYLKELDVKGLIAFCKDAGLDGVDFTVRPGYPVTPDNVATALPEAAKQFQDAGLVIGLVTMPTNPPQAESKTTQALFETCGKLGIPAIKIGYYAYSNNSKFDDQLKAARTSLANVAKLAEKTKVKACYHTHSGSNLGSNGAAMRLLFQDLDPHHIGAFLDTGHTAVGGGPIRLELAMVKPWLSLLAIKDIAWEKKKAGWSFRVVPAGEGIVRWNDVAAGLKDTKFNGTISVHGEYEEVKDLDERRKLAKQELEFLKKMFG